MPLTYSLVVVIKPWGVAGGWQHHPHLLPLFSYGILSISSVSRFSSSSKGISHKTCRAHATSVWAILTSTASAKSPFPNKVAFRFLMIKTLIILGGGEESSAQSITPLRTELVLCYSFHIIRYFQ